MIDFEWFTTSTDYGFPTGGCKDDYEDFGFNKALFPEPAYQLANYDLRPAVKRFARLRCWPSDLRLQREGRGHP